MASQLFSRAARPTLEASDFLCHSCRRHQSTYRRTRKALRVKPDPSFLPSQTEPRDHIIFNPPSSAPNVYHTPLLFLPKTDPRRKFHSAASASPSSSSPSPLASTPQPTSSHIQSLPSVRPEYEKKYHLGQEHIDEIRRLRAEDPRQWTRVRLAEKFECSQYFVSLCCSAPEVKAEQDRALAAIKMRWGRRKTEARELRVERKKLWGRDA